METFKFQKTPKYYPFMNPNLYSSMGIQKIPFQNWFEIDKHYSIYHKMKQEMIKERRNEVFATLNTKEIWDCKIELLEMIIENLTNFHSDKFELIYDEKEWIIFNKILNEKIIIDKIKPVEDPLIIASMLVQEDLVLLTYSKDEDSYLLTSAALFFPDRWKLSEKHMKRMNIIHDPVDVYQKHLVKKVDFFLKSLTVNESFFRLNWAIVTNVKNKFDMYTPVKKGGNQELLALSDIFLRVERQTFRKLPKTQNICFGIKTYQKSLTSLTGKKVECLNFINFLQNMEKSHKIYKELEVWEEVVLNFLKEQVKLSSKI